MPTSSKAQQLTDWSEFNEAAERLRKQPGESAADGPVSRPQEL